MWSCAATSGWCRSKAGRSERIRGSEWKLCRGGGHEVAHSREAPKPQGSSTSIFSVRIWARTTLRRKGRGEAPMMKAPTVETWSRRSSDPMARLSAIRRGATKVKSQRQVMTVTLIRATSNIYVTKGMSSERLGEVIDAYQK